ncbi:pyridoxamine 5'-phosphate oxidase family protein [Gymnodinialimonas hymeniacidonis]|uniref:pyridoxamine 5'-phosphate oxidase family protein n=1 Tax=Gymnodinialimonas hymeniacidonis TaxID=3126508 RepID=UPI0034C64BD2
MRKITDLEDLSQLYGTPVPASLTKVMNGLTPLYRRWIDASRFVVLSTVGPEGTDASPRGDDGPVVKLVDDRTIWLPDWRGNNRIDNLRNIVRDPRVSLMFMVPGCNNVVRVNGSAFLTDDPEATGAFEQRGRHPKTVIVIETEEIYFQCAKALMRSGLWSRDDSEGLPTPGDFVKAVDADFDGAAYDSGYVEYAKDRMW